MCHHDHRQSGKKDAAQTVHHGRSSAVACPGGEIPRDPLGIFISDDLSWTKTHTDGVFRGKDHHRFAPQEPTPMPSTAKGAILSLHFARNIPPGIQCYGLGRSPSQGHQGLRDDPAMKGQVRQADVRHEEQHQQPPT